MRPNEYIPTPRIPLRRVPKTASRRAEKRAAGSGPVAVFREVRNRTPSVPLAATSEAVPVKAKNTHPPAPCPGHPSPGDGNGATAGASHAGRRRTFVVLSGFAAAFSVTPVLAVLGAATDAIALTWIVAAGWAAVASFVQALRDGIRHGDWSAFVCGEIPRNDEDLDFSMKSGRYAHLRVRATHEALMRESGRFAENPDRTGVQP